MSAALDPAIILGTVGVLRELIEQHQRPCTEDPESPRCVTVEDISTFLAGMEAAARLLGASVPEAPQAWVAAQLMPSGEIVPKPKRERAGKLTPEEARARKLEQQRKWRERMKAVKAEVAA
jgi:hypothetical protein